MAAIGKIKVDIHTTYRPLDILRDENGKPSSTRLLLILAASLFTMVTITDTYWDVSVNDATYDILRVILGFGLGGQAARTTIKNWREEDAKN